MRMRRRGFRIGRELETVLREQRAEARDEFVDRLSERLEAGSRPAPRAWSRVALAGAVSTFILGTVASFGGLGYAASGAEGTYHAVKQVAVQHTLFVSVHKSSAADQYSPKPKAKPKAHKPSTASGVAGAQAAVAQAAVARPSGTLPFTGISLATTLLVSLALIAAGLVLRRRERRN
jgi:hypothetical protein